MSQDRWSHKPEATPDEPRGPAIITYDMATLTAKVEGAPTNSSTEKAGKNGREKRNRLGGEANEERHAGAASGLERERDVPGLSAGLPGRNRNQQEHGGGDGTTRGHSLPVLALHHDANRGRLVRPLAVLADGPTRDGLAGGVASAPSTIRPEPYTGIFRSAACVRCGRDVEETRRCYAIPHCYACLPPPPPLPRLYRDEPVPYPFLSPEEAARVTAGFVVEL